MDSTFIIIILIIAIIYLVYKYQQIGKNKKIIKIKKKIPQIKKNNYMANRDVMPHMIYSSGPFDESIWRYPEQGGRTIVSQQNSPYGQGLLPRPMPPNSLKPRYIGKYPYYNHEFNKLYY